MLDALQCLAAVLRHVDGKVGSQLAPDIFPQVFIIVDDKHPAVVERLRHQFAVVAPLPVVIVVVVGHVVEHALFRELIRLVTICRLRDFHREDASAQRILLESDFSVMRKSQLLGEIKTYATAVGHVVGLHKSGEELRLTVLGHPHASILHTDDEFSFVLSHPYGDITFPRGVLEGVAEQVIHYLVNASPVNKHRIMLGKRHEEQVHLTVLRQVAECHGDIAQETDDVGFLQPQG